MCYYTKVQLRSHRRGCIAGQPSGDVFQPRHCRRRTKGVGVAKSKLPENDYLVVWYDKSGNEGAFRFMATRRKLKKLLKLMQNSFRGIEGYGKRHWAVAVESWKGRQIRYSTRCPKKRHFLDEVLRRTPRYINQLNAELRATRVITKPQCIAAWQSADGKIFVEQADARWLGKTELEHYVFAVRTPDNRGYDLKVWRGFEGVLEALAFLAEALYPRHPRPAGALCHPSGRALVS